MARSRLVKANEKIAEGVTSGFQKMSDGVTGGFQKMSDGVVGAYKKVEDAFVDRYLTHDGESVEAAKARIQAEQAEREVQHEAMLAQAKAGSASVAQQAQEKARRMQGKS